MASKCTFVLLIASLVISDVLCQTFQYSRGWTNGKRAEFPSAADGQLISIPGDEHFTSGEFRRLKMLVHGITDEQPLLIPCEFVDKLRKLARADN